MKTDTLFYRFFQELPECFFALVGRPASDAERFRFEAIELKDTAVGINGVYSPRQHDDNEVVFFVEFQNHPSERTYSNLLLKVGLYLEKVNPRQNWQAVVIYRSRSTEQANLLPYRTWLQSEQLTRIYLDELPEPQPGEFGLSILRLIIAKADEALGTARRLIPQVRESNVPSEQRAKLIELIETVVAYQFPKLTRKELEKMLQIDSFRETKVYKEAFEEGIETVARRLLEQKFSLKKIAELTGLSEGKIKRLQKKPEK